jgi:YggT family protein
MLILKTLLYFIYVLEALVFARVILSWLPAMNKGRSLVHFIVTVTDTLLQPIRSIIKKSVLGGSGNGLRLDYAPLVAFLILDALTNHIRQLMVGL